MKKKNLIFLIPTALLILTSCFGVSLNSSSINGFSSLSSENEDSNSSNSHKDNTSSKDTSENDESSSTEDSSQSEETQSEETSNIESSDVTNTTQNSETENDENKDPAPLGEDDPIDINLGNINVRGILPDPIPFVQLIDHEKVDNLTFENIKLFKDAVFNTLINNQLTQYKEESERYSYSFIANDNEILTEYMNTANEYSLCGEYINKHESYQKIRQKGQKSINGSAKYELDEYFSNINDGFGYLATSNIEYFYPNRSTLLPFKNNIKHVFTKEEFTPTLIAYLNQELYKYPEADERKEKAFDAPFNAILNYAEVNAGNGSYANIKADGSNIYLNIFYTQTRSTGFYAYFTTYEVKNGIYTGYLSQQQILNDEGKCVSNTISKTTLTYNDLINKPLPSDTTNYKDFVKEDLTHLRLLKDVIYHPFNPLYTYEEVNLGLYEPIETPLKFFEDIKKEFQDRIGIVEGIGMRMETHQVTSYSYNKQYTDTLIYKDSFINEDTLITGKKTIDIQGIGLGMSSKLNQDTYKYEFNSTSYHENHTFDKENQTIDFVATKQGDFKINSQTPTYLDGKYHYSLDYKNQAKECSYLTHNMEHFNLIRQTKSIFSSLDTQFKNYNPAYPLIFAYQSPYDDSKIIKVKGADSYIYVFRYGLIESRIYYSHERSKRDTVIDGITCNVKENYSLIENYSLYDEPVYPDIVDKTYTEMDEAQYNLAKSSRYSRMNY